MKINGYQPVNINPYKKALEKSQPPVIAKAKDKVVISSQAKQMQANPAFTAEREKKVAKLKQQIESGTYQINPQEIAKKFYEFWNK